MPRTAYWLTFTNGTSACAWVPTEQDARDLAAAKGLVVSEVSTLPHPARPRLDDGDGWGKDQCPSFCHQPTRCRGRTTCAETTRGGRRGPWSCTE